MTEDYSKKSWFQLPEMEYTMRQVKRTIIKNIEGLFEPTTNYLEEYEPVLDGSTTEKIRRIHSSMHAFGVIMRKDEPPPPNINIIG